MMDKKDNLFAVNGRGCPSKERTGEIWLHGELNNDLAGLWKDLNMKDGTSILIALAITTDEMQRHVHIFTKVMFMGMIANTNYQKPTCESDSRARPTQRANPEPKDK